MELKYYLDMLWRRKLVVLATLAATVLVVAFGTRLKTPTYEATVNLRMTPTYEAVRMTGTGYVERMLDTYASLVTSSTYREEAAALLERDIPSTASVSAEAVARTYLMSISVEDTNPAITAPLANTLAEMLIAEHQSDRFGRVSPLSVIDYATAPTTSSAPSMQATLMLGVVLGTLAGIGLAFAFEYLDNKLYTTRQIEDVTQLPSLAHIPAVPRKQPVLFVNGHSVQGTVYQQFRTRLFALSHGHPLKSLMLASAVPDEGKSTVVANLAFALAQSGQRVAVVDADVRQPALHTLFGLPNDAGLSTVLKQGATLEEALYTTNIEDTGVSVGVLPAGPTPEHPAEMLASEQMTDLLHQLEARFDMVLLDTTSFDKGNDAVALATVVDGVLLVVRQGRSRQEPVQAVRRELAAVQAHVLGVIVNHTAKESHHYATA